MDGGHGPKFASHHASTSFAGSDLTDKRVNIQSSQVPEERWKQLTVTYLPFGVSSDNTVSTRAICVQELIP